MILKSLSILGFKSFAERVYLEFGEGVTAIVGPNGSGKSNIADAIQWVLGEQNTRHLRAENSTEVIFAGSSRRKPLGMAEVSLTIDNSSGDLPIDFTEVTVTRRLYRSGESEYFINKVPCRLKDIVELFMDTGLGRATYAILTQNEVDMVLSSRPEERRALIEEAAGIQKYRHRKREALRKLENTEANLTRIRDILAELEMQREPLRQQAEVALRYHHLVSQLRAIEVAVLWAQIEESQRSYAELLQRKQNTHEQLLATNALLAEREKLSQRLGLQIAEAEANLDTLRALQQASLTAYERAESRRALTEQRLRSYYENLKQTQEEINDFEQRLQEAKQRHQLCQQHLIHLQQQREEALHRKQVAQERLHLVEQALQQAQQHYVERTQQAARSRAHLESLRARRNDVERAVHRLQEEVEKLENALHEKQQLLRQAQQHYQNAQEEVKAANDRLRQLEQELQQARGEVERSQQALQERSQENARLSARLQTLLESEAAQEGLLSGVKAVLEAVSRQQLKGSYLLVADVIHPLEPYLVAIEVALGSSAQDIVTATEEEARAAIEWLKRYARGRATFLPLNLLRPAEPHPALFECIQNGLAVGLASQLVQCPPEIQVVADYLLGRVLVAQDFDSALYIVRRYTGWSKVVTLQGELFLPGGAITGGKMPGKAGGIVSRKAERARVERALRAGEGEEERLREHLQRANRAYEAVQQRWREALGRREQLHQAATQAQSTVQWLQQQHGDLVQQLQTAQQQLTEQAERLLRLDEEAAKLEAQLPADDSLPAPAEEVSRYRQQRDEALVQLQQAEVDLGRLSEQERAILQEQESLVRLQQELRAQQDRRRQRITELQMQIEQEEASLAVAAKELERIIQQRDQIEKDFIALRDHRQQLLQQNLENSEHLKQLAQQQSHLAQQAHELELSLARVEMQRAQAAARLLEEYEIDVSRQSPPDLSALPPNAQAEIQRLRREIRQMGNVNIGAAEEYQRLNERYEFLQKQQADLEAAREDILEAIQEIDSSTRGLFMETFHAVQQAFQQIFERLFGGGKAELVLTQPHNLLETGVDIVVQLPGRRQQNLSLLSGGERALVALALMFAFLQVKPSPFCVLDEVDAALDGANVEKFVEMLRENARRSQMIIITHNPVTMENADVWYGVTMREQGVSQVISYRTPQEARSLVG